MGFIPHILMLIEKIKIPQRYLDSLLQGVSLSAYAIKEFLAYPFNRIT